MTFKAETFSKEITYIHNNILRNLTEMLIEEIPDYVFKVSSSSSRKYHPDYANGDGGLVRHIKATVRIAESLMSLEMYSNINQYHDYIIMALLLHDSQKYGRVDENGKLSAHTLANHAFLTYNWLMSLIDKFEFKPYENVIKYVAFLILTHMGQWNTDNFTGQAFAPKPQTQEQMFVHLCDYLASRRFIEINFDKEI